MTGDIAGLFQAHVHNLKPSGSNGQFNGQCPFHQDKQPSFSVNLESGLWICHADCGKGDAADFAKRLGLDPKPFYQGKGNGSPPPGTAPASQATKEKPLSEAEIEKARNWYAFLQDSFARHTKGLPWNKDAVKRAGVGYDPDSGRFVYVHRDSQGRVLNIKHGKGRGKQAPYNVKGHGQNRLYPLHLLKDYDTEYVIFTEGEPDVVTLLSHGFQAITGTTGAGSIPPDLRPLSRFKAVVVIMDHDEAGITGSAKTANAILAQCPETEVCISYWPENSPEGYDITDFFQGGRTANSFREILESLSPYEPEPKTTEPVPRRFPQTDAGQGEYFASLHGDRLRYNHKTKTWLLFKKHWWQPDAIGEIMRLATEAARHRYEAAWGIEDHKERESEAKFAIKYEQRTKIDATLALAQCEPPIADAGEGWDPNPWLLGAVNGVIDLQTGKLRNGVPGDRISKQTRILFDPEAKAPRWEQFIREITSVDPYLIEFIWKAVGYSLTGNNSEQCLFMCYGSGANGKTTFLNMIRHIAGSYGYNTSFATLEINYGTTSTHDLASLDGRRLVTASETSETRRLNEARIKALTGGDPITARHLYEREFIFQPTAKFWLGMNHKPVVRDDSFGFWRRVRLIPFLQQFIGEQEDRQMEKTLRSEAQGVLAWAVNGCLAWQREGLEPPECVTRATQEYQDESDPLSEYLYDCCIEGDGRETPAGDLYKDYKRWCEGQGLKRQEALSARVFGLRLSERFEKTRKTRGNVYLGVGLKDGF